jgi:hypothetical protein
MMQAPREEKPGLPSSNVEEPGEPEAPGGTARKDDGLEGVKKHREKANDACHESKNAHGTSFREKHRWECDASAVSCILRGNRKCGAD